MSESPESPASRLRRAVQPGDDAVDAGVADPTASDSGTSGSGTPARAADPTNAEPGSAHHQHLFTRSLLWTTIGTLIPGLGFWPTRHRKLGVALIVVVLAGVLGVYIKARTDLGGLAAIAVQPRWLTAIAVGLLALALIWVAVIVGTHLMTRPKLLTGTQRAVGSVAVAGLSMVVAAPLAVASTYALDQKGLVTNVFKTGAQTRSETRPTDVGTGSDPWANKPRLNILLLGGDNSAVRDKIDPNEGIRTDTVMMASIDTATGNTVLIQLPRNMEAFPFPAGSALAKAYPNGYWDGVDNENPEFELNSVWDNVPRDHPNLFKNTDYPNADAVKYAVQGITGLKPDYFVLLSIDGLQKVIDAMGGVRINVNQRIPMGQNSEQAAAGIPPSGGWLEPGPNQLLNGYRAMWYARSRSQSNDPQRMARQSCVVKAVIDQANPQTLLTHYESIADAGKNALLTDIPQEVIPAIVPLALKMKDAKVHRLLFGYNTASDATKLPDGSYFKPWKPDVVQMAKLIQQTIAATDGTVTTPSAAPTSAKPTARATSSASKTTSKPTAGTTASVNTNADLGDVCAYHPGS